MATATLPTDLAPDVPPPASINPKAAAVLADLRTPLVANDHSLHWITENICSIVREQDPVLVVGRVHPVRDAGRRLLCVLRLSHLHGRRRLG